MTFAAWVTRSSRACSRRLKRARLTYGGGSSYWPTPTASDAGYFPDMVIEAGQLALKGPFDAHQASGGQFSLENAARVWTVLWRVLKALGVDPAALETSSSPPVRLSLKHGRGSSPAGQTSNPRFYEKVMGWPTDWTAPEAQVTEFAAWLQLSRGRLSELLTIDGSEVSEGSLTDRSEGP